MGQRQHLQNKNLIAKQVSLNPLVPSKPHYGHCNVGNEQNSKSVKNWSSNFEVQMVDLQYTSSRKIIFQFRVVQLSKYL